MRAIGTSPRADVPELAEEPGVGALVAIQSAGDGFRLIVVRGVGVGFETRDERRYGVCAEAPGSPAEQPCPAGRRARRHFLASVAEAILPEPAMAFFRFSQPIVELGQVGVVFSLGQLAIEEGAIDFVLDVVEVAAPVIGGQGLGRFRFGRHAGVLARAGSTEHRTAAERRSYGSANDLK
ncbi:MAG: hypothetical protein U5Q44_13690 [Dehalococcoidia bacterium]|nr:hypothetical protein [Dehalococcoidia bacterium]